MRTEHQRQYHFFEWLSAVLLYEATGYLSLVESYTALKHHRQRRVLQSYVPKEVDDFLMSHQSGLPDLFVYHPESKDWFFCEVKGGRDSMRDNQCQNAKAILKVTKRSVRYIHLVEIKP